MTTPLPDGRVPMTALLDEQDEAFLADWAAADAEARDAMQSVLAAVGERPLPAAELRTAAAELRADIARPCWRGRMLISFSGLTANKLPADDEELWLVLATSVASPQGDPLSEEDRHFARAMEWADEEDLGSGPWPDDDGDDEPDEMSAAIAAVCALDHFDWLAVMSALITGGPGTPASATDLARYVRDFDPDEIIGLGDGDVLADVYVEDDEDDEFEDGEFEDFGPAEQDGFDELSIEGLFLHVTTMWSALGAIDSDDRLTPLGWWGLPEAMRRAWAE